MNKQVVMLVTIIVLSFAAYLLMFYAIGWTQKKSAIIAFGAGGAMIIMEFIIMPLVKRRRT
jgi:hypothetical protein